MDLATASMASQCRFCAQVETRNISIAFLKENGGWYPENLNPVELESRLNIADAFKPDRTFAHRKTKFEIFHSASTLGGGGDGGSDSSDGSTPSAVGTLCAFCRHLNLKRLCSQLHNCVIEITLGSLGGFHSRPDCSLCAFLLESIATTFSVNHPLDTAWTMRTVYLRFACEQAQVDSRQGVNFFLCISEEPTNVPLRVYEGSNSDTIVPQMQSTHYAPAPRLIPPFLDWSYFQRLVLNCIQTHPECCSVGGRTFPAGFRLIDVKRRKIVRFRNDQVPYYLALSYVWGAKPDNRYLTTKETIDEFERESSLSDLPQTIEDCFEVCRQFRTPYLWVDRLCIVQNDYIHKMQQINAMDTIYRAAEIVIVAASASHLHEGLAGISTRRKSQPELLLQPYDLKIVASLPRFAGVMQRSTWQSRGWTYQEAVLGRRKLYLTSIQAFFDCGEGRLVEMEDDFAEGSSPGMSLGKSRSGTLWQYYFHIDQYNRRSLKDQSDVYKAVHGIIQTLYSNQPLHFGLPASDFDQALLWRGHSQNRRFSDKVTIPAWSWSSTNSGVQRWPYLFLGALVSWSICVENTLGEGELVLAEAKSSPETWLEWKPEFTCQTFCPQLAMAIAWSKECIEAEEPFCRLYNDEYTIQELQTELCALWPTYEHFWDTAFPKTATMTATFQSDLDGTLLPGMLIGRVQLKQFTVTRHDKPCFKECNDCIHDGRLQIKSTSSAGPAGMLEQPHPDLESIHARSDSLYFAGLSISEWQGSENCFDWIPRDPNLSRVSARCGENRDSFPPGTLWDLRARLFHQSGRENFVEDNRRIWSLNANLPLERPPLLVNVMLLDVNGHTARYVCKGWMFLSIWCSYSCGFRTVAISP